MKKICILAAFAAALLLGSCQKPEYVDPTADRQGLTSLTAIFTFGPFMDQEAGKLDILDETATTFSIPIPYYYPATSDDETSPYMTKMRVQANLEANCSIEPALGILDLTKENKFLYTDALGNSKQITITGHRYQSSECQLLSFSIVEPPIAGIVDQAKGTVSLISIDDLGAATAEYQVSPHATISPDPSQPLDYNDGLTLTVIAADGVTSRDYYVAKSTPEKIPYGFSPTSVEQLFNFDPASNFGAPAWNNKVYLSMGVIGRNLVICYGDGSAPLMINKLNGSRIGTLNVGSAKPASIASDEADHLLLCSHDDGGGSMTLWMSSSVTDEPTVYHTFTNPVSLPLGYSMKVIGDLSSTAQIVLTAEGVPEVTTSSNIVSLSVEGGKVTGVKVVDATPAGLAWGGAPVNTPKAAPLGVSASAGWMAAYYDANVVTWVKEDGTAGAAMPTSNDLSWGWNPIFFDGKQFNNASYVALLNVSYFPCWGIGPHLYLYDVTDPSNLSGEFTSSGAIVLSNPDIPWYQQGSYDSGNCATGDVIIAPSADGFSMYVYYYDHHSGVIGGYSANCLK